MDAQVAERGTALAARVLRSGPITRFARHATASRLRVLAYHDVRDVMAFSQHLDLIEEFYRPVTGADVQAAVTDGRALPRGAVWVTFDDAYPGAVELALPLLRRRGIPATIFVCPALIDTDRPFWWQVLEAALDSENEITFDGRAWSDRSIITRLKSVPDAQRRATIARVTEDLEATGSFPAVKQATSANLRAWLDAGLEVGNHTWDHPCLDTCDDEQQRHQIVTADTWMRDMLGVKTQLFAYPNGNTSPASRNVLDELGYAVTALFDHRVRHADRKEISRLRIDSDAPADRFVTITSGAHSAAFAATRLLRRPVAASSKGGSR